MKVNDEMATMIALEKHRIKQKNAWINKLLLVMNDEDDLTLNRSDAYDKIERYKDEIAGSENHLRMLAQIVAQAQK